MIAPNGQFALDPELSTLLTSNGLSRYLEPFRRAAFTAGDLKGMPPEALDTVLSHLGLAGPDARHFCALLKPASVIESTTAPAPAVDSSVRVAGHSVYEENGNYWHCVLNQVR